jgi:hypothetical protein
MHPQLLRVRLSDDDLPLRFRAVEHKPEERSWLDQLLLALIFRGDAGTRSSVFTTDITTDGGRLLKQRRYLVRQRAEGAVARMTNDYAAMSVDRFVKRYRIWRFRP